MPLRRRFAPGTVKRLPSTVHCLLFSLLLDLYSSHCAPVSSRLFSLVKGFIGDTDESLGIDPTCIVPYGRSKAYRRLDFPIVGFN